MDFFVAEVSSCQIATSRTFQPHIAVFLNYSPDHTDWHGNEEEYFKAKASLFIDRNPAWAVLNAKNLKIAYLKLDISSETYFFNREAEDKCVFLRDGVILLKDKKKQIHEIIKTSEISLKGKHNLENIMAAIAVCHIDGVDNNIIRQTIMDFSLPEHRLEYVATIDEIDYYNDSKATNCSSAICAMKAFEKQKIVLIAGGKDKGTDLTEFSGEIRKRAAAVVLIGEAADRFEIEIKKEGFQNIYREDSFEGAIDKASQLKLGPVVLSPACASFDMFGNFEERGKAFNLKTMSSGRKKLARVERRVKRAFNTKSIVLGSPDKALLLIICALLIFGIIAVFSAGAPEGAELYGNVAYFLIKHLIAVGIGIVFFIFAYIIDYGFWKKFVIPITYVIIALLIATLIPGMGKTIYGSSRWLAGIPLQPSEFCKIATVLLVSAALVESKNILEAKMLKHLGLVLLMILILLKQPNLSNAVILALITLILLLVGGVSFRLLAFSSISAVIIGLLAFVRPYQLERIKGWLNPWADPQGLGYNLIQSFYAIGSGEIFGVGYGNSRQKLFWLPFSHTDFIFAIIAEELGLIGCIVLIGLFLALLCRGFYIANRCSDRFGKLVAFGITFSIIIQAFVNIGVTVGVIPVTGVTLPLISHGGTSVVLTLFMLGILMNISRKRIRKINRKSPV